MHLVIIRGIPGSGKSTMAQEYVQKGYRHFEADMFYMNDQNEYVFDPTKIKDAHAWCQEQVRQAIEVGVPVVVSNTFTQHWEYQPYVDMASKHDYDLTILVATGRFKNIHNVPDEVISRMVERFQY